MSDSALGISEIGHGSAVGDRVAPPDDGLLATQPMDLSEVWHPKLQPVGPS